MNKENLNIELVETDTIEASYYIEETSINQNDGFLDFYNRNSNLLWDVSVKLKKIFEISIGDNLYLGHSIPSNFIIFDNFAYYVNSEAKFIKLDLQEKKKVFEINLEEEIDLNLILPTSLAKSKNDFYVGLANGTVIKFDNDGKIYWKKVFNDLLRTPLRVVNDNIILIFNSNKIIALNSSDGHMLWEFMYNLNKPTLSTGGQILIKHNLVFFVMPNGRIGAIDTIVGEPINYSFLKSIMQKNILNYNYEAQLHIYNKLFSLVEEKNIIYTYDLDNEEFLLFDEKIYSSKSIYFLNNSLLILENNNFLTSNNIVNNFIFWKVDLSNILSKKDKIVESYVINNTIIIFFSTGKIIQLNKLNGKILFKQDLNLTNVDLVTVKDDYFIFNQSNGKVLFYRQ